jgi:hypothetical protein
VPNGPKQFPGRRFVGQLRQELLDRPKPGRKVVAVIAVAEDGVEPRQVGGVAVDRAADADQGRPDPRGVERQLSVERHLSIDWPLSVERHLSVEWPLKSTER